MYQQAKWVLMTPNEQISKLYFLENTGKKESATSYCAKNNKDYM